MYEKDRSFDQVPFFDTALGFGKMFLYLEHFVGKD